MTDSAPARLTAALADRYTIERELGAGGMATVYLAQDLKHDRQVAVKVLRPELAAVIGAERFVNEIKVTANLQHPHILALYDSGEADTFLYYVMPYVEGESLDDRLQREKQLGVEEAVRIAGEVANALDYAHRHGVVHRDIKPGNVMLQDGQALVADFGIALALRAAGGDRLTETGLSLGTPYYMSPEQATGERDVDGRTDIYSLGAVLYEMLAGEPPHTGSTVQAVLSKVVTEDPRPLTDQRRSVPVHVAMAGEKALAKVPADRFDSAADFATALKNPDFTLAASRTAAADAARPERRGPSPWLAWGGWAAAAVLLATTVLGLQRSPDPPPTTRFAIALPEDADLQAARGTRLALAPDASRLVYTGPGDGGSRLWVRERDELTATPLPGTERSGHPFFSPDGRRVGLIVDESPQKIKTVALSGGPPITVTAEDVGLDGATWSEDGFIYFDGLTAGGTNGLSRIPPGGGPHAVVTTVDTANGETDHVWPHALPQGRGVLFTILRGSELSAANIALLAPDGDTHQILTRGAVAHYARSGHLLVVTADGNLLAYPFDLNALEITGDPTGVAERVAVRAFGSVDLALSADGTLLYVQGEQSTDPEEVVWISMDGGVTPVDPGWVDDFTTVAAGPDGRSLAVSVVDGSTEDLWIKTLPSGPVTRLTFNGTLNYRPSWTPDGASVLFTSNRGRTAALYTKPADGGSEAEVLLDLDMPVWEGILSRDGDWLVFRTQPRDLWALSRAGDTVALVETEAFEERAPALSPDSRWLAYQSDESGPTEVYVRPFPVASSARWQVSTNGGSTPRWAPDGGSLYYRTPDEAMVAVEVLPGTTFTAGQRRVLFTLTNFQSGEFSYDVMPDGERFVMIRSRMSPRATQIIIVQNFFEDLRRRAAR